jgi:hypothetical protein
MRVFGQCLVVVFLAAAAAALGDSAVPLDVPPGVPGREQVKDAATIMAAAREALGGEQRLSSVKNFVVTGRTRQVRGDNLVPIEFEIAFEMPDKFVRKDEIPAQESGPTSTGFNGDELIQFPVPSPPPAPSPGRAGGPPPPSPAQLDTMRKARVAGVKQDFVRLALGMFAGSFATYPLTFTYVGQAEAPQGKADVVDAKGPANFTVRLFVNSQTHLPIMVSWQAPAGRGGPPGRPGGPGAPPPGGPAGAGRPAADAPPAVSPGAAPPPGTPRGAAPPAAPPPGGAPPAGAGRGRSDAPAATPGGAAPAGAPPGGPAATPGGAAVGAPPGGPGPAATPGGAAVGAPPGGLGPAATPVEYRIYYADYRDVDGLQWPFRLRRATGTETTEETTFDRFRINTRIDQKKFEVRK